MVGEDGVTVLRAKYRDYCSARLADALLEMRPEEVFSLAQKEANAESLSAPLSHPDAIRLATQRIRSDLNLPEFEAWAEDYKRNPERYEPDLLGLWKSEEGVGSAI